MVMMTNPFVKFPNQPTDNFFERLGGSTLKAPSSDEVGETSGTDETRTLGVTGSRYRGGIKIATGSALIGQTLSPTKGIKFELKRTGLSGVHSASRFEIWNNTTIISSATVTFQPDTKVGTSYAYVEFFPASTVTLQANDRITIATDGGVTNYYTFRSNASGSYDTTKTHWTESTYNSGSGGTWTDDTGRDGNFKFTLVTQQPSIKTHFIEWFSGKQLPSYWNTTNINGSNTFAMADSVDGGFQLTTAGADSNSGTINFNNKYQYSPTGAVMISVWKKNINLCAGVTGFKNATGAIYPTNQCAYARNGSTSSYVELLSGAGTVTDSTDSTTATSQDFHSYKIELSSDVKLTYDGTLIITKSGVPSSALQPFTGIQKRSGSGTAILNNIYLEAYNT